MYLVPLQQPCLAEVALCPPVERADRHGSYLLGRQPGQGRLLPAEDVQVGHDLFDQSVYRFLGIPSRVKNTASTPPPVGIASRFSSLG